MDLVFVLVLLPAVLPPVQAVLPPSGTTARNKRYYRRPVLPPVPSGTTASNRRFFLLLDTSFSLADFFPFSLFVFRVFVAILTQASASKSSALIDTATLEHHPPPTVASPQQYQRYNLRHFDSPISSFVCIYPMRATHFVFV